MGRISPNESGLTNLDFFAKTTAVLKKCDEVAVTARNFAEALRAFQHSRTTEELEEKRKAVAIARVNFDQVLKQLAAEQ
jgi:hypothetical protein